MAIHTPLIFTLPIQSGFNNRFHYKMASHVKSNDWRITHIEQNRH